MQTFVVVVKEEQEGGPPAAVSNISSPSPRFTVSNLQAGTAYRIYVYSSNAKGHSEPYQLEIITAGKRIPDADTSIEELPPGKLQPAIGYYLIGLSYCVCGVASALLIGCERQRKMADILEDNIYVFLPIFFRILSEILPLFVRHCWFSSRSDFFFIHSPKIQNYALV